MDPDGTKHTRPSPALWLRGVVGGPGVASWARIRNQDRYGVEPPPGPFRARAAAGKRTS